VRSERATERRGELASIGASDRWETWRLYRLGRISHISRISPIGYQRPASKISSRRAATTQDTPTRRHAETPTRSYGLPDGEATGELCSERVALGLVSSFVAAVGDGTGVGVSAGVADANGVADVSGVAEVTGVADV
jgi:hypothetical protein